ncbi:energy transducer TonB [Nevskia sp.]|uniref:energy transducer TonB n=1 Tax=Nevskia sp. TaxID=1929292 RepID=UPI0025F0B243|nr:energy transducer TonB [Nevskia sp.]
MAAIANLGTQNRRSPWRWLLLPPLAALIVLLMVVLMRWMIWSPHIDGPPGDESLPVSQIVKAEDQKPPEPDDAAAKLPELAPPPPPDSPPSLARASLPNIPTSSIPISVPEVNVAAIGIGTADLGIGAGLGTSGVFGGFAGGGNGTGNGGGGGGGGGRGDGGFKGRELVPLSTARPQMPDWACKKKIRGWVEVVFVVKPNGLVENVRIVDADPKGVYEGAAIESVGNWIYPKGKTAAEVKQKVEMDPADCAYNYR